MSNSKELPSFNSVDNVLVLQRQQKHPQLLLLQHHPHPSPQSTKCSSISLSSELPPPCSAPHFAHCNVKWHHPHSHQLSSSSSSSSSSTTLPTLEQPRVFSWKTPSSTAVTQQNQQQQKQRKFQRRDETW